MGKWYNEAVFYHMYPLGMTGAPKENKEPETVHRLRELFPWIDHLKNLSDWHMKMGSAWLWTVFSIIPEESFLHFRISRKTENILRTAAGIKE